MKNIYLVLSVKDQIGWDDIIMYILVKFSAAQHSCLFLYFPKEKSLFDNLRTILLQVSCDSRLLLGKSIAAASSLGFF